MMYIDDFILLGYCQHKFNLSKFFFKLLTTFSFYNLILLEVIK